MPTTTAAQKPAYLGLLNAIALAEASAGVALSAWADATADEELAQCLRFVAARETSHGEVFRRRLNELGFEVRPKADPDFNKRLARAADPKVSDLDKVLVVDRGERGDPFAEITAELGRGAYDPMTANLFRWYIAEEHDSEKRLRAAYDRVRAKASGQGAMPSADAQAIMACMTAGFARLEKSLEKLAKAVK